MTNEEAIEELESQYEYVFNGEAANFKVIQLALKALKKQVPMKPVYVDTRFRNHGKNIADGCSLSECYKCPNCSSHIFKVWNSDVFCPKCGQALDWEEEDTQHGVE